MNSVIKGTGYILIHVPDMVLENGTTQTTEKIVNPDSEYLKNLPDHLRSYKDAVEYLPNQVYIGNSTPEDLTKIQMPFFDKPKKDSSRFGKFGEIMPQNEFLLLVQACDVFDVVKLSKSFVAKTKDVFANNNIINEEIVNRINEGIEDAEINDLVKSKNAEPLFVDNKLIGCVKSAHDIDVNLSAHVIHENLMSKASSVLALLYAIKDAGIEKSDIDYVIDCAEEACGDMNQRGGGNFAKAAAEITGLVNATGSDTRGFCAAPAHAIIEAASLVSAGTYKTVVVTAGGCTAKLGMNGKKHVEKDMPILEDCLGGFAVVISENDGKNPEINLDILGKHTVGTGSSPQAVIGSLVANPLKDKNMKILDIDKFAPEMQNPDITKPAGAGDVPLSNYKMIGAMAAKNKEITPKDLPNFVAEHGLVGWAPTQGHIPSGIPYLGFARKDVLSGKIKNAMIIGKGSLFLGRMTNLFDGVSFVVQKNSGTAKTNKTQNAEELPKIAITGIGSEHGENNVMQAAINAVNQGIDVYYIGTLENNAVTTIKVKDEEEAHKKMKEMIDSNQVDGAVTMHFPFPIGISTVGKVVTPAKAKEMFVATTTGTSSTNRTESMVKNAIYGIAAAKACGNPNPSIGILNIDGARQCEKALKQLKKNGYDINFAESVRSDGGPIMRGNDVLLGTPDILICDSLTGNIIVKMLSAFSTGGTFETTGYGYGPGIGENYDKLVGIISRASGAPLITSAIQYMAQAIKGKALSVAKAEHNKAKNAGLEDVLNIKNNEVSDSSKSESSPKTQNISEVKAPPKEVVTEQIAGIEIMDLEDAVQALWKENIYAESGMGCTGPVVLINPTNLEKAKEILEKQKFI